LHERVVVVVWVRCAETEAAETDFKRTAQIHTRQQVFKKRSVIRARVISSRPFGIVGVVQGLD
jgi:hypothetical protein